MINVQQLEMRGIDPRASHMLSERSTTWATPPVSIIVFTLKLYAKSFEFFASSLKKFYV